MAKTKITFIKSPTGAYKMAYSAGDTIEVESDFAHELFETGFAKPDHQPVTAKATPPKETATAKAPKKETRTKKKTK